MDRGRFIALEGIDGCGKTTQAVFLADYIRSQNRDCLVTMEPSAGPVGAMLRQILTGRLQADERVIAGLFASDRLDHLLNPADGILEKLNRGACVIMDRYYFSSYAYNGVNLPMEWVISLNEEARKLLKPDMTVFIDISVDAAMERILKNRGRTELFEKRETLSRVRENYMEAFRRFSGEERVMTVNGEQEKEALQRDILLGLKGAGILG